MKGYKVEIKDEFDNWVDDFVLKAKNHKEALKKTFEIYLKKHFEEDSFGNNYCIKVKIVDEEII